MKLKINKSRILLIVGVLAIIIIIVAIVGKSKKEEEQNDPGNEVRIEGDKKIITSEKLSEIKELNGLEFSNIQFEINNATTEISAEVRNTTSKISEEQKIDFNVFDKQGNKIVTIGGYVVPLEPGESRVISTTRLSEENDAKAYNVEVVLQETNNIVNEETNIEENNENGEQTGENSEENNNQQNP